MKSLTIGSSKKRIVLIIILGVLIIGLGVYIWLSVQAWNTSTAATVSASKTLKSSVDDTLAVQTTPELTQAALSEVIATYDATLQKGPCELSSLYQWQSSLPWLKDTRQECLTTARASDELAQALKNVQTYLKQEAAAASLLKQASETTNTTTNYADAATTWQKVSDTQNLTTEDAFKPVGTKIIDVSKAISSAYLALETANKAEDKAAFDTAKQELANAYARVAEIKTSSSEAYATLVTIVVRSYENA